MTVKSSAILSFILLGFVCGVILSLASLIVAIVPTFVAGFTVAWIIDEGGFPLYGSTNDPRVLGSMLATGALITLLPTLAMVLVLRVGSPRAERETALCRGIVLGNLLLYVPSWVAVIFQIS